MTIRLSAMQAVQGLKVHGMHQAWLAALDWVSSEQQVLA